MLSELGKGGMGVVYLAEDETLDRKVALKFIRTDLIGGQDAETRLLREARTASALDHPNIGTIYEVGEWQGHHFIAMAYYEGETLAARVERGPLEIAEAAAILEQIAGALARAHASGIVHRDLKPANVFLVPQEARRRERLRRGESRDSPSGAVTRAVTAKLLDFGLARQASEESTAATRLTAPGTTVGTVAYMSPEQARGEEVDASADLWAFGVIAYELLSGRRPFPGVHPASVLHAIIYEPAPDLKSLRPDVPERLRALVAKALAKDKAARHQSAAELLAGAARGNRSAPAERPLARVTAAQPAGRAAARRGAARSPRPSARARCRERRRRAGRASRRSPRSRASPSGALRRGIRAGASVPRRRSRPTRCSPACGPPSRAPRSFAASPRGPTVSYKDYATPDAAWVRAGVTPLQGVRVPAGVFRWRFEKPGFETLEIAGASGPLAQLRAAPWVPDVTLEATAEVTPGMILVPGSDEPQALYLPGFEHLTPVRLDDVFWMDEYEVTNEQFKAFVDASGYQKREYWTRAVRRGWPAARVGRSDLPLPRRDRPAGAGDLGAGRVPGRARAGCR